MYVRTQRSRTDRCHAYDSNDGNDNTVVTMKAAEVAMPFNFMPLDTRALNSRTLNTQRGLPGSYPRLFCAHFFGQEQQGDKLSAPPLRM